MTSVHLTPREREVLVLTMDGLSVQEIANELGITHRTAKLHTDMLRAKFGGLPVRRELIRAGRAYFEAEKV